MSMEERKLARPIQKPVHRSGTYTPQRKTITPVVAPVKFRKKQKKKVHPLRSIILTLFAGVLFLFVFPFTYTHITRPLYVGQANEAIKPDYKNI